MKEELYIIRDAARYAVDLLQPSGISLQFNSNIFNDLSKIDCSKTFTFKLPNTANNARVFDLVGDMRHDSALYGLKIPCEFWVDGVPIVTDGNLYVSELQKGVYSAVMTFAFVAGLQAINDDDVDISELGDATTPEMITYGWDTSSRNAGSTAEYCDPANFDNTAAQTPLYSAGVPYYRDNSEAFYNISNSENSEYQRPLPPPVMPLHALMLKIQSYYGLTFDFIESYDYTAFAADVANGVTPTFMQVAGVPFVTTALSEEYEEEQHHELQNVTGVADVTMQFTDRSGTSANVTLENTLQFQSYAYSSQADFIEVYGAHYHEFIKTKMANVSLRIGGHLYVSYNSAAELSEPPHLRVVMLGIRGETELANIEGQYDADNSTAGNQIYFWDFRETEGFTPYDCETIPSKGAPVGFAIDDAPDIYIGTLIFYPHFEEGVMGHPVRVFDCLPDISCMTLLKSLYYILGGFPKVNADGSIGISYYTDIETNKAAGNVYDWTDYALIDSGADPDSLKFTNGKIGIKNYLLMKNESLEPAEASKTDDVYDSPRYAITCQNYVLDKQKTLFQHPFYGRFIQNGTHHSLVTGNTIKYWSVDNNKAVASEAKPAIGRFDIDTERDFLTFSVWQAGDTSDEYTYLQSILQKPYVVKIPMRLAIADLVALDYTRPVYIGQLNAYFAIVQIVTNSNGTATAELIKLP